MSFLPKVKMWNRVRKNIIVIYRHSLTNITINGNDNPCFVSISLKQSIQKQQMIHVIILFLCVNEYSLKPGCSSTTTHNSVMNVWFQIVSIQSHPNLSQLQMDSINSSQTNTHHFHLLIIPTYHSHYSKNTYSATESSFTRKTSFHQSWIIVNNKCLFLLFL